MEGQPSQRERLLSVLSTFENVFVNPTRLDTAFADIVHTHVSNFEYVSRVAEFEYFSLGASNDLFVRHMPPVSDCDANFGNGVLEKNSKWYWYPMAVKDEYLYKILDYLGASFSDIRKSQIEGSFYRKELFQEIAAVINKVYGYEKVLNKNKIVYPREEVYYPTIANILGKNRSLKIIHLLLGKIKTICRRYNKSRTLRKAKWTGDILSKEYYAQSTIPLVFTSALELETTEKNQSVLYNQKSNRRRLKF